MDDHRTGRALDLLAVGGWLVAVAGLTFTVIVHKQLRDAGHADLSTDPAEAVVYGAALISASTVGLVVAVRQRRHPVGWLFLSLGLALAVGAAGDAYALDHGLVHGDDGAVAGLALVAGQASFIAWFGLLAAILHLTPTGHPVGRRARLALVVTTGAASIGLVAKAVQDAAFDPPYGDMHNPWAIGSIAHVVDAVAGVAIGVTMIGLLIGGAFLIVRFRRAEGVERQQLRWMAVLVIPLPVLVVASYAAATADLPVLRTIATGGFVALFPIAAGLSVQRFRLYDVDRILSRATAYALSSISLAATFGVVTAVVGRTLGLSVDDSTVPAVAATIVTVTAAAPVFRRLQDVVDRRFDRRRYDAHRLVREHLGSTTPTRSLEATLAAALRDPSLTVAYWLPGQDRWAAADGRPATLEVGDIEISRGEAPVARLRVDRERTDVRLAATLAGEVLAELDNVRLRAEVVAQLEEVRESRARIVAAQAAERHRIERNLHDGAQQRLLGLAMHLRAAELRDGSSDQRLLNHAVEELGAAVRDLRDLANGLHPAVLADGGLPAALDELAGRVPLPVALDVPPIRLPAVVEETLWFVACEALANTVKHAGAGLVRMDVTTENGTVRLRCSDDGRGGADPAGRGLRGIADRTEAAGGRFHLHSPAGQGTMIEAELPCEL